MWTIDEQMDGYILRIKRWTIYILDESSERIEELKK